MTRMPLLVVAMLAASLAVLNDFAHAGDRYVVHEWGTFTVLQDEHGNCLPGVNVNEERLPEFVYRLWPGAAREASSRSPILLSKGVPSSYVPATLRMETPIIYIYPPKEKPAEPLDVNVRFHGGWISEWYPAAAVSAPGLRDRNRFLGELAAGATGSISWSNLQIGVEGKPPATDDHVWLAPRATAAGLLATEAGETEHYLFYRGIAALEAPVRVVRDSERNELVVKANDVSGASPKDMSHFWLVDVRADRSVAYRQAKPTEAQRMSGTYATLPAAFPEDAYSKSNLTELRTAMNARLIAEGLFADEAEAMLRTWELSYFQSPGLRLFFTLPRHWTETVLPLELSQPANIQRVMIGRVEIVTPAQRELLKQLSEAEIGSPSWLWSQLEKMPAEKQQAVFDHEDQVNFPFEKFGLKVPRDYRLYAELGRFRDALILDAIARGDAGNLAKFVRAYQLSNDVQLSATEVEQ